MASNDKIVEYSARHPYPHPKQPFGYGTAGFRMKADLLDSVVYRVGLLAALRSRANKGQAIGVMITASHNPPEDNGVKIVDPLGDMMKAEWEQYATDLANASTDDALVVTYNELCKALSNKGELKPGQPARVIFARDTRESGERLVGCLVDGLEAVGLQAAGLSTGGDTYEDFGELTTPQLHYLVRCENTKDTDEEYGDPSEEGYYKKLASAFKLALKNKQPNGPVTVDCANGVGGPKLKELIKHLDGTIDIKVMNDDVQNHKALNVSCGSDYVKDKQIAPPSSKAGALERCASLDGDADRIVYYFNREDGDFVLLDGDRIATLAASFLGDLKRDSGLPESLKIGVVQTAYANGGSTDNITSKLKLEVVCTATGVKHLHHAALEYFDIGVYFEANGHGTVLFRQSAVDAIKRHEPQSPKQQTAFETLKALTELINQTVGDALSDLLLVEVILAHKAMGPEEWRDTYKDLPNRLLKVKAERTLFKTTKDERRLTKPDGLQNEIDDMVGKYQSGRSFARPSGTENVVRVYAEAFTKPEAEELAIKVKELVEKYGSS